MIPRICSDLFRPHDKLAIIFICGVMDLSRAFGNWKKKIIVKDSHEDKNNLSDTQSAALFFMDIGFRKF